MTKSIAISVFSGLLISSAINGLAIYAESQAVSPNGSVDLLWSNLFLFFISFCIAGLLLVISGFGLIPKKTRRLAILVGLWCLTYFFVAFVCVRIAGKVRMHGFRQLAQRSETLIDAIHTHVTKYGHPPNNLDELVPEFLKSVSNTGMGAYPDYEYAVGEEAQKFDDNPWAVHVFCPRAGLNWDMFMYFPKQNYPSVGYGGRLEKIEKWAYVHE